MPSRFLVLVVVAVGAAVAVVAGAVVAAGLPAETWGFGPVFAVPAGCTLADEDGGGVGASAIAVGEKNGPSERSGVGIGAAELGVTITSGVALPCAAAGSDVVGV